MLELRYGRDAASTLPAAGTMSADERAMAFLYGLRRIPIDAWTRCCPPAADEQLETRLSGALEASPRLEARIRRRVDHVLAACAGIASQDVLAGMRTAACQAAGALAARPRLSPEDFERLYAPFATLAPDAALTLE